MKYSVALLIVLSSCGLFQSPCGLLYAGQEETEQPADHSFEAAFDPQTIPFSKQNYYAPKQTCAGCHEKEFRQWQGTNHHLAMGNAVGPDASEMIRADFNNTQYMHVGFDDLAKLSDGELKLVLSQVDLVVIAKALTDARSDVLPKVMAALSSDDKERLQKLTQHYAATVVPEMATPKRAADGSTMLFDKVCPVRMTDAQLAHAETVDVMQRLFAEGKIDLSFGQLFRFFMRDNRPMVECENHRGERETFAVKYTFGITPLQQYLVEFDDGRVQCLPVAWDVERGRWFHLYPKERILFNDALFWTKPTQNWNYMCASCHTTDLHKNYDVAANTYHTRFAEMGVGCQSCHGPGGWHVERMSIPGIEKTGNRETDMALPIFKQMSARDEIEICAPCHAHRRVLREGAQPPGSHFFDHYIPSMIDGNLFYADGQILEEDYEYTSFLQCRMMTEGLRCTTCHDPHSSKLTHEGNALCTQCHDASYDSAKHHYHEDATQPGTQCVECHMPTTTYMQLTPRHDHNIKVPDPELTIRLGIPNACNQCHNDPDAGETPAWALRWVRHWYGSNETQAASEQSQTRQAKQMEQAQTERVQTEQIAATQIGETSEKRERKTGIDHFAHAISGARRGDAEALPKLLDVAANRDEKEIRPLVRASAITLLGPYPTKESLTVRVAALSDVDPHIRLAAASTFETASVDDRLAYLLPLLDDETYAVRCETARLLSVVPPARFSAEARETFDAVLLEYVESQNASLDHPAAHLNLAVLWENQAAPKITDATQAAQKEIEKIRFDTGQKWRLAKPQERQILEQELTKGYQEIETKLLEETRMLTQKSLDAYQRALLIDPDFVPARVNLAMLHNRRYELAEAETELRRVTEIVPDNGEAFYSLGLFLAEQNRLEEAETALSKAVTLSPDNTRIIYNYSLLLMKLDKIDEAEQLLIKAYQANQRSVDILSVLVTVSVQKREYTKALGRIQLLRQLEPDNPEWAKLFQQIELTYKREKFLLENRVK